MEKDEGIRDRSISTTIRCLDLVPINQVTSYINQLTSYINGFDMYLPPSKLYREKGWKSQKKTRKIECRRSIYYVVLRSYDFNGF